MAYIVMFGSLPARILNELKAHLQLSLDHYRNFDFKNGPQNKNVQQKSTL